MAGLMKISFEEALQKGRAFCAYQERSPSEVYQKMMKLGLHKQEITAAIEQLEEETFLDEFRFARVYARSKFRQKGWGKMKITNGLREKRISSKAIEEGLLEIVEEDYLEALREQAAKKAEELKGEKDKKPKLLRFLASRGFESHLIWKAIDQLKNLEKD